MLKFIFTVFTVTIFVFCQSALCDQDVSPSPIIPVEIEHEHDHDYLLAPDSKHHISSIVKCGMDLSEPVKLDYAESGPDFNYTVDDTIVVNISKCDVKSFKMDLDSLSMGMYLDCPYLGLFGKYSVKGKIVSLFLEGQGDVRVLGENCGVTLKGHLEEFVGNDGQKHLKVKNFTAKSNFQGPMVFSLTNLFNGNEYLSREAHNYFNSNWRDISAFAATPLVSAGMKPLFKNINKCLKPIPVNNIQI